MCSIEQLAHYRFINRLDQLLYITFCEYNIFDLNIVIDIRHKYN